MLPTNGDLHSLVPPMSDQFLLSTRSSVAQVFFAQITGEMANTRDLRDGPADALGRGSPAARWSLELAEKVSNYLNICRIGKSSRSPRKAPSFVRCNGPSGKMPQGKPKSQRPGAPKVRGTKSGLLSEQAICIFDASSCDATSANFSWDP